MGQVTQVSNAAHWPLVQVYYITEAFSCKHALTKTFGHLLFSCFMC